MSPGPNTNLASPRHFSALKFVSAFWFFPSALKHALVYPRIKKSSLDPHVLNNYRPISNLSYISKLVERVVAQRFTRHVSVHNLFPPQQSADRPFHSTEAAVLAVHNSLVRAVDEKHVPLLLLLDLSAASTL